MARTRKNRILIICSNWGLKEALSLLLEKEFKVFIINSMNEIFDQKKISPDLILIDDDSPDFNKEDLHKFVSDKWRNTYILLFIDFLKADHYTDLHDNEFIEILEKPFNNDILLQKIELLVGRKVQSDSKNKSLMVDEKELEIDDDSIENTMEFIKLYIQENYDTILSVKKLAEETNMGYRTLLRYFADYFDMSLKTYINNVRLEKMIQFIQFSNMDVHEICLRVGFKDKQYAVNLFKNKYGFNPHQGIRKFRHKPK